MVVVYALSFFPSLQRGLQVRRSGKYETLQLTHKELKRTEDDPFEDVFVASSKRHACYGLAENVSETVVVILSCIAVAQRRQPNQLRKIVSEFRKGAVLEIILRRFDVHAFEGPTHKMAP